MHPRRHRRWFVLRLTRVRKVKGHAGEQDVLSGRVSEVDRWGKADALAVAGAASHAAPLALVQLCRARRRYAIAIQAMLLRISKARRAAESHLGLTATPVEEGGRDVIVPHVGDCVDPVVVRLGDG